MTIIGDASPSMTSLDRDSFQRRLSYFFVLVGGDLEEDFFAVVAVAVTVAEMPQGLFEVNDEG